jgi:hypothetical protein
MRQLSCMSADVYCQKLNNQLYTETSYLYLNGKIGKQARCQRDRERVCVRHGGWLKIELASSVKTAVGERLTILGLSRIIMLRLHHHEKLF